MNTFLVVMIAVVAQVSPTVDELVDAHESALGLIHTLDLEIETCREDSDKALESWRWTKQGTLERFRTWNLSVPPGSRGSSSDWFMDGTTLRQLDDWNPDSSPKIEVFQSKVVGGSVQPQTRQQTFLRASSMLMMAFSLDGGDKQRTLRELVQDGLRVAGSDGPTVKGLVPVRDSSAWQLHVPHAGVLRAGNATSQSTGNYIDVFLDPARNFRCCKVIAHETGVKDMNGKVGWADGEFEAVSFQDFGDGVFLPMEVRSHVRSQRWPEYLAPRVLVRHASVNQKLPKDAFAFAFPENLMVPELPPGADGRATVYLYGANNKIVKTIRTEDEMQALLREYVSRGNEGGSRKVWMLAVAVPIALILCLAMWRRHQRGRAS